MSTNVDLEKKIKELTSKIQDPPGNGRRPDNRKHLLTIYCIHFSIHYPTRFRWKKKIKRKN